MISGNFSNLKHLNLTYCAAYSGSGLIAGLGGVAETLTKLEVNLAEAVNEIGDDATLPYKTILSICPNLEQFRYDHDVCDVSKAALGSLGPAYTSKLIQFQLKSSRIELVNIEDILESSPELRSLELNGCTSAVVDVALAKSFNELNLRTLFQGFAAKAANQSTLQKISLTEIFCDARFTIANVLDCLPDIATLRKVEMAWCRSASESAIIRFCKRLQSHPYIEAITFEDLNCITDESLKSLAAIKGLRNLRLASIENITEQGIQFFAGSSIKLNVLACGAMYDICI
ncbi:hypothetical protein BJV82DRAFT_580553 [Fennellomyces sp. T-0311]|nr:hypothetical protein BJV82DRAFT_580553 [Fennellomyces sp. T-0311]